METADAQRILIFGGTTEGRAAVKVAAAGTGGYLYSTLGTEQRIETPGGRRLTGALTAASAAGLCRAERVRLIIDAAHPFAAGVHDTVARVAAECGLPVIRYERREEEVAGVIWCDDYADAVRRMEADGVRRLLALSGVRTIQKLREFWTRHLTRFRVLDRPESIAEAVGYGFPREGLIFFDENEPELDAMRREATALAGIAAFFADAATIPLAVLTKESGASGRFPEKVAAARELGIPLYAIRRPAMPAGFHTVYTEAGLRRRIDELLPGYFALRSGYTTGTCATAAACAALQTLLSGEPRGDVTIILPGGERVTLPVERATIAPEAAEATVVKDAGDDPDVTDGAHISARVTLTDGEEVRFLQGEGVGRVTLPGLGLPMGEAAVNPVPRRMIRDNFEALGITRADVTITVENGEQLAQKTLNARLGVVGGISILGTTGVVMPFSDEAFIQSVEREVAVARAVGSPAVVLNSGAKSERAVRGEFPDLPPQAFVHYGNHIGAALRAAAAAGFGHVAMGVMIGKAVKLAEGHLDTHSRNVTMNREFLRSLAAEAGCSAAATGAIDGMTLARELWTALPEADLAPFMRAVLAACHARCAPLVPAARLSILMIPEEGAVRFRV